MNEIEAAAKAMAVAIGRANHAVPWEDLSELERGTFKERVVGVLSAAFVALVGCDQCGGTGFLCMGHTVGKQYEHDPHGPCMRNKCSAEHVELVNPYGGTVWADPNKVIGWCYRYEVATELAGECSGWDDTDAHDACGWVRRPLEIDE